MRKTHFLKFLFTLLIFIGSGNAFAHSVVSSICRLKYEHNNWHLYFNQKTRPLRDVILKQRSDLKGSNLNSKAFLDETKKYISKHLIFRHKGKLLKIIPKYMKYDGRNFKGQFVVEGLGQNPEALAIETSGFEAQEHAQKILSIHLEGQDYLQNFNQKFKKAIFSFETKDYRAPSEKKPSRKDNILIIAILGITFGFGIVLRKMLR